MTNKLRRWISRRSEVVTGALTLLLGMVGGRAIGILVMPLLTRLYTPAEFAVLSLFAASVGVLNPLVALRYPAAVPLPKLDRLAINLVAVSLVIGAATVGLIALVIGLGYQWLLSFSSLAPLQGVLWIIPLSLALNSAYELASFWSTRKQSFSIISRSLVVQAVNGSVVKCVGGWLTGAPSFLVLGQVVAQGSGIWLQIKAAQGDLRQLTNHVSWSRMRHALRFYWRFPAYVLPSQLLSTAAEWAPVFFISAYYGAQETGSFGLAMTLISLPVMLIGKSISRALFGKTAHLGRHRAAEILQTTLSVLRLTSLASVPLAILLFFFAEPVLSFVLGEHWRLAGQIAALQAPMLIGLILFTAINPTLSVFHRQSMKLMLDAQRMLVVLAVFVWSQYTEIPFLQMVQAYSFCMFGHFFLSVGWVMLFLKRQAQSSRNPETPSKHD